jgi:hypothetical protein
MESLIQKYSEFRVMLSGFPAVFLGDLSYWLVRMLHLLCWNSRFGDSDFGSDNASDEREASYKNTANFGLP